MGHDAKVSLKHYAQTTEEHFDRTAGGAKSGAPDVQNQAQRQDAETGGESHGWNSTPEGDGVCAIPGDTQRIAAKEQNG
jgi:hypothetical protein